MTRYYREYCPVAHALEVVGDRWSLLIIRDLLRGSQRFTDLLRGISGITAKLLMVRLRKLQQAGVVKQEKREDDRREVWYTLTAAGHELRPVLEALWAWGVKYAMWPPRPGEVVRPEMALNTLVASLNTRGRRLSQTAKWAFHFTPGGDYMLSFDGERWWVEHNIESEPDVSISATPESWATFLAVKRVERAKLAHSLRVEGKLERVKEFWQTFGIPVNDTSQLASNSSERQP